MKTVNEKTGLRNPGPSSSSLYTPEAVVSFIHPRTNGANIDRIHMDTRYVYMYIYIYVYIHIRRHTSFSRCICFSLSSAYVSIRQHTLCIRRHTSFSLCICFSLSSAYVSIRHHTLRIRYASVDTPPSPAVSASLSRQHTLRIRYKHTLRILYAHSTHTLRIRYAYATHT